MVCKDTGVSQAEADAMMAASGAALDQEWLVYQAQHPTATHEDFARYTLKQTLTDMGTDLGLSEADASRIAQDALRRQNLL